MHSPVVVEMGCVEIQHYTQYCVVYVLRRSTHLCCVAYGLDLYICNSMLKKCASAYQWVVLLVLQVEPKRLSLLMDKGSWESELRKTKGQLFYLQSLEKVCQWKISIFARSRDSHSRRIQ